MKKNKKISSFYEVLVFLGPVLNFFLKLLRIIFIKRFGPSHESGNGSDKGGALNRYEDIMIIERTKLDGCYIIQPKIFKDDRGYFFESFNEKTFNKELGLNINFIQDNQSFSTYGVLRGLHFQTGNDAQAKLVSVLSGIVLDVVVDIRPDSETFGQHLTIELNSENKTQLFIPRGFAHGFLVLSKTAEFFYKVDNYYSPESEAGILFNDPELNINWQIDQKDIVINRKDLELPPLKNRFS